MYSTKLEKQQKNIQVLCHVNTFLDYNTEGTVVMVDFCLCNSKRSVTERGFGPVGTDQKPCFQQCAFFFRAEHMNSTGLPRWERLNSSSV